MALPNLPMDKKYEGHAPSPWRRDEGQPYDDEASHLDIVDANGVLVTETSYFTDSDHPNIQLIIDAPDLLAKVIELERKANSLRRKLKRYETTDELRPRTEKVWRNYLDRIHNADLNHMARNLGLGSITAKKKHEKIDLLIIHLDVMEKLIK